MSKHYIILQQKVLFIKNQKLQYFDRSASMNDIQATGEASSPQKGTSSAS